MQSRVESSWRPVGLLRFVGTVIAGLAWTVVPPGALAAQETVIQTPPNRGGETLSMGLPPTWRFSVGGTTGVHRRGEVNQIQFLMNAGIYKDLLAPVTAAFGILTESYVARRGDFRDFGEGFDAGFRLMGYSPAFRFAAGYDYSIDDPCRICNKPIRWDYNKGLRKRIYQVWASIIELREGEAAFRSDDFRLSVAGPGKRIEINHPDMDVRVIGNFDVSDLVLGANFSKTGWWYEYFTGDSVSVTNLHELIPLEPGEYRIYTTKRFTPTGVTGSLPGPKQNAQSFNIYPNPVYDVAYVDTWKEESSISVVSLSGQEIITTQLHPFDERIELGALPEGMYIISRHGAGREPEYAKILKISH